MRLRWTIVMMLVGIGLPWSTPVLAGDDITECSCPDDSERPAFLTDSGKFTTITGYNSVTLSWQDNSDHDAGYIVERSPDGLSNWTPIAYTPNNYIILHAKVTQSSLGLYPGLAASSVHYFRVHGAVNTAMNHCCSATRMVKMPATPLSTTTPQGTPVPRFEGHVGFPIELSVYLNVNTTDLPKRCSNNPATRCTTNANCTGGGTCASVSYYPCKISGPSDAIVEFKTGSVFWTPSAAAVGSNPISVGWVPTDSLACTQTNADGTTTFSITVDDNTMTQPVYRDYRNDESSVPVLGRAHDSFSSYALFSTDLCASTASCAIAVTQESSSNTTPVTTTGPLADWNVAPYQDGSRKLLSLIVQGPDKKNSAVYNPVIIDRTAYNANWPKRLPMGSVRGALAVDLDNDGRDEIIANSRDQRFGGPYVWDVDGNLLWQAPTTLGDDYAPGTTESEVAVGDVDGDGFNDVVSVSMDRIKVFRGVDGTGLAFLALPGTPFRAGGATLADVNGDRHLEILINTTDGMSHIYQLNGTALTEYPGWPKGPMASTTFNSRPSVADLNGDGGLDVVVDDHQRVYAWSVDQAGHPLNWPTNPVPFPSPNLYTLADHVTGGVQTFGFAQPSIGDLDADGTLEIIVGRNVIRGSDGTYLGCFRQNQPGTACAQAAPMSGAAGMSAAIGDFDHDHPGPEVLLGGYVYSSDLSQSGNPIRVLAAGGTLGSASIVDGGVDETGMLESYALIGTMNQTQETAGLTAFEGNGAIEYSKSLYGGTEQGSVAQAGDFDGDGNEDVLVEVSDSTYGAIVALYRTTGQTPFNRKNNSWPMAGHDPQRTGRSGCKQQHLACSTDSQCCSARCVPTWPPVPPPIGTCQ